MEAGRELNAKIAEEVMGWKFDHETNVWFSPHMHNQFFYAPPNYSTLIVHAMPVFDRMIEKVGVASIIRYAPKGREPYWEIEWRYRGARVREQTLELAICAFALAVVNVT